jgi:hypothetical protein
MGTRLPSFRSVAAAAAALLLASPGHAEDVDPTMAERFSVGGSPQSAAPALTLLDPSWMLPPLESLDTAVAVDDRSAHAGFMMGGEVTGRPPLERPAGGPLSYALFEDLTAQLRYRHSQPFDRASSKPLREDPSTAFSTGPDRDVLDLNMSWSLAGSTVGLGYQLQSARGDSLGENVGLSRFLPGSDQATHSLTLGLTRTWGGGDPPPLIEPPLLAPELDAALTETTPTPAP